VDTTNTTDLFYYTQPVESADQALSLSNYLNRHGVTACQDGNDQVTIPVEHPEQTAEIYQLIKGWRKFWEHSDRGLLELPIYQGD
jgi:hypothetical protein